MSTGGLLPSLDPSLLLRIAIALMALAAALVVGVLVAPLLCRQRAAGSSGRKPAGQPRQHLLRDDGAQP